jgi:hypothetical protein
VYGKSGWGPHGNQSIFTRNQATHRTSDTERRDDAIPAYWHERAHTPLGSPHVQPQRTMQLEGDVLRTYRADFDLFRRLDELAAGRSPVGPFKAKGLYY